jgi:hypothetical protein
MVYITIVIVAIWWNPYRLIQYYIDDTKETLIEIELEKNKKKQIEKNEK